MISATLQRRGLLGVLALGLGGLVTVAIAAEPKPANIDARGLALRGYDPVAYFTEGEPTKGDAAFEATFDGATYRFASATHREMFLGDPARYVPAYGGYCAFGAAMGRKFDGDPEVWAIVDGRLFVNINQGAQQRWEADVPGFIRGADHNWPLIENVADSTLADALPRGVTLGAQ